MTVKWVCWELRTTNATYVSGDHLIREVVAPIFTNHSDWFFLRYWNGGAHLRVRVRATQDEANRLTQQVRHRYEDSLRTIELANAQTEDHYEATGGALAAMGEGNGPLSLMPYRTLGVYEGVYEPELRRYGGVEALPYAERCFTESSRMAVALIVNQMHLDARASVFTRVAVGAVRAFEHLVDQRFATVLQHQSGVFAPAQRGPASDAIDPLDSVVRRLWQDSDATRSSPALIQAIEANMKAAMDDERSRLSVLLSQLHMTANRFGLPLSFESRFWESVRAGIAP